MATSKGAGNVAKLKRFIDVMDPKYGAVGDGSTDDLTALTSFFNDLIADPNAEGRMPAKTFAISGALPTVNVDGFELYGFGPSASHDVGSLSGTIIKAITNSGFTMLTVAPTDGASNQALTGIQIKGVTFDCNSLAAKGVVIKSTRYSDFDLMVANATTNGLELGVVTTLGEAKDVLFNRFRYIGRQAEAASGVSLRITGDSSANVAFNNFDLVDIVHKDAIGIIEENADNNVWHITRVHRATGGSASNSVEWRGGASESVSCRDELFIHFSSTVAAIAKGTGSYTVGANHIAITHLDKGNSTPDPTVETGASVYGDFWRSYTPTASAGSGTFTSVSATGRVRRLTRKKADVEVVVTITTNGTAASFVRVTAPVSSGASAGAHAIVGIETASTGQLLRGLLSAGSSNIDITATDGSTYPGADGRVLQMAGSYETD